MCKYLQLDLLNESLFKNSTFPIPMIGDEMLNVCGTRTASTIQGLRTIGVEILPLLKWYPLLLTLLVFTILPSLVRDT